MATINNMLGGTYSLYQMSIANGSLFGSNKTKAQDSISSLWNSYSSYQSNASEALSGLSMISSNVSSLLSSYDTAKQTFYDEFDTTMNDLQKSSDKIKSFDFNVGQNAITTKESVDEDGNKITTTEQSDKLKEAITAVKDFVNDYNDSLKFFSDNSEVSKRVGRMNTLFADTTYRRSSYESIGISVGGDGKLTVDEDKLASVLVKDSEEAAKHADEDRESFSRVANVLGKDGLAGKADSHISTANSQKESLFPSVQSMFGKDLATAAMYTGSSYRNMSAYNNVGSLINMMF